MFNNQIGQNPIYPEIQRSPVVIPQITIPNPLQANNQPIRSITVDSEEVAKNYTLPPNSKTALFLETAPIFFFKQTDESGNVIAFKKCSYMEVTDPPEPEYLTVQEFRSTLDEFAKRLKEEILNGESVCTRSGKHSATE